jgi:dephospho-CoA kinase
MKIIGLTGGIGSGKSTVAGFLAELGAVVLDADKIWHEILETDAGIQQQIVDTFGKQVLSSDGIIDRKKLAAVVFKDRDKLMMLNSISHPAIYRHMQNKLDDCKKRGVEVAVIEAPLLIEAGWAGVVDEIWVTVAPAEKIIERLVKRGMSKENIQSRMNMQILPEDRIKTAKIVIDTDKPLEELKKTASDLWYTTIVDTNRR